MNVQGILIEKLKALGADGLCRESCGCGIDELIACCDGYMGDCVPALKTVATEGHAEYYSCEIGDEIYIPLEGK